MPISRENLRRYPPNWAAVRAAVLERAGHACECSGQCGLEHAARCGAPDRQPHPVTGSRVVLTVAHLNHTPEDCRLENLLALCQQCHNRYDKPHRMANARRTVRARKATGDLLGG